MYGSLTMMLEKIILTPVNDEVRYPTAESTTLSAVYTKVNMYRVYTSSSIASPCTDILRSDYRYVQYNIC